MMNINKIDLFVIFAFVCHSTFAINGGIRTPVDLADPFIDTKHPRYDYFISASVPFGMVALSPDTKQGGLWDAGYRYDDQYILNFAHVHNAQIAGIPVMPVIGPCKGNLGLEANKSRFSHEKETAKPGYHKLFLEDYKIKVELTATCRVGMHRYTFPGTEQAHILFDLGAAIGPTDISYAYARQTGKDEIEGYSILTPTFRRKKPYVVHFVARFNKPFDDFAGWKNKEPVSPDAGIISGERTGVYVTYKNLDEGEKILAKVAISYVSAQNARVNMETELPHWNFDQVVAEARGAWNNYLGRIRVEGGTQNQQVKFYTDLMHTAVGKRIASDVDGSYADWTGPEPIIRSVPLDQAGKPLRPLLDADGLWGGQWNLNILWPLVYPEYGNWVAETFLDYYRNAGTLARGSWGGNYTYVMVGDQTTPLLAALLSTGRATFDPKLAYEAARKNAFPGGIRDHAGYEAGPDPAGGGIDLYIENGFVPVEINRRGSGMHRGGTAMTLEYAWQDWCLAQMARQQGKEDDARLFLKRSENWRNVFDPVAGWMRPRYQSGEWMEPFSPVSAGERTSATPGFIEGNAAIYTFYVPQNIGALIEALGGRNSFSRKLESSFEKARPFKFFSPQYSTSWVDYQNQPSCHLAHLFNYTAEPWKTQYWVRQVKEITFGGTDPYSGYNGDDDQGMMGALGVLMAIGLFDVQGCVGETPELEVTSPLFDKTRIEFPSVGNPGKTVTFEIIVKRKKANDLYIQKSMLNGRPWNSFKLPVASFLSGGKLEIDLGPDPNKKWGIE
jgi:predicted alpha-1,2-mannosidase